ncbi:TPA: hypothetical protein ACF0M1_002352 [Enterococcus hirae]|uniref:Uncharacterized protein n=2 Tax=Enterococcus hirae TaxID=1354 RepID=G0YP46_ENTHA|nr:hypothetical protein [Enterococcus hirae]AEJ87166.1 hypothetical protein EHR_3004 [Enterococcus hirae ATCC 9790]EOH66954.1 hypothetical protein UAE_02758 [Enterococcus hirae ATCC 9790]EOU03367.1 hypothetical protein I584_02740 [Enterococcus hirae ATCC 9790]QQY20798.1 hypothetical protein I6I80_00340 [Enterococcus hirae]VTQ74077.1 Uncharacterised protein [Enterococcus hirae]
MIKIEFSRPLHRILHDEYGFLAFPSSPGEKERKEYERVCKLLNRTDLPFKPYVPVMYERRLSNVTSLMIEGEVKYTDTGISLGYRYDFYKTRYILGSSPQEVKVYCREATRKELLQALKDFKFLKKGE